MGKENISTLSKKIQQIRKRKYVDIESLSCTDKTTNLDNVY